LRTQMQISKQVALFPVIQLEKLTDLYQKLFPLPGYHVSAYDQRKEEGYLIEKNNISYLSKRCVL
ncbi:MAG: hypothetical protein WBI18_07475, partial [Candidatus Saccharicenans sp.]